MHSHRALAWGALILTLATGFAATKPVMPPKITTTPTARAKPPLSDGELEKTIRARFSASKISTNHFQVHVQGGVATIEGQTDVIQHKGTATRLARTSGALKVVNHIAISEAAREKAAKNLASGRRRAQVKRSDSTARGVKRSM